MKRAMYKQLTKEMLQEWGIESISWDADNNEWWIDRYWFKNNSKEKRHIHLAISTAVCKHKYTQDKKYPIVTLSYKQKIICLPLSRIIYAWFNGEVPAGLVVDHINNNPFDNRVENLQLMTQAKNLEKRYIDNRKNHINQWDAQKYALVHEYFEAGKSYEEALAALVEFEKSHKESK